MISSPRIVPWRNCLWDSSHYSSLLCVRSAVCLLCSPTSACTAPLWSYSSKRKKKDFFPCFTGTINVPWPSRLLLLSFSLILSLFPSPLWGFFSLLDGAEAEPQTNFSHSRNEAWRAQFVSLRGNRIHSSVPQKTPFFQTERELFVWWQLQLSSRSSCDSLQVQRCVMACCVHITGELCHHARWCLWRINQTVHRVPFSKMELPNDSKCEKQSTRNSSFDSSVLKKTLHEYQSHSMVLKRERSRGGGWCLHRVQTATVDHLATNAHWTGHLSTWRHTKETGTGVPEVNCRQSHTYVISSVTVKTPDVYSFFPLHQRRSKAKFRHADCLQITVQLFIVQSNQHLPFSLSSDLTLYICFHSPQGCDSLLSPNEQVPAT